MSDIIIQAIETFFSEQGFVETELRGYGNEKIFKYKDGYYMISRGAGDDYYLEDAETLEEARNKLFEDMEAYKIGPGETSLIAEIKKDIIKYIINKADEPKHADASAFRYASN